MANYERIPRNNLSGKTFGRLTVKEYAGGSKWVCECSCGEVRTISTDRLKAGLTKSCGCLRKEVARRKATKHGGAKDPLYHVLNEMHQRCENPHCKDYKWYGAEGKTVCKEWSLEQYNTFRDWAIRNGYKPGLTIDRIDASKGYYPENCRWITLSEQQLNRRDTKHF